MPYLPHTEDDRRIMLERIGVAGMEDLLAAIPADMRAAPLDLPAALSEPDLLHELEVLASRNTHMAGGRSFLGGGSYNHHIPAVVGALAARGEFVTAYTPYQPEVSQGTLQVIYEWQSHICELTGLDIANASLYDAATACAEAMMMAINATGRDEVVAAGTLNPEYLQVLRTYCWSQGLTLHEVPGDGGRVTPQALGAALTAQTGAVIVQSPNYYGLIEEQTALVEATHAAGGIYVACNNPLAWRCSPARASSARISRSATHSRSASRCPTAARTPATSPLGKSLLRRMPGRIVGASRRLARPAGLRDDPAHPRAAHPPRQGDQQHLLQPTRSAPPWPPSISVVHGQAGIARGGQSVRAEGPLRGSAYRRAARLCAGLREAPSSTSSSVRTPRSGAAIRCYALLDRAGILGRHPPGRHAGRRRALAADLRHRAEPQRRYRCPGAGT